MPLREYFCPKCGVEHEAFHWGSEPIPEFECPACHVDMNLLASLCRVDTSSTFNPMDYTGPDGRKWKIDNLHSLRQVEHEYTKTGHNVRFDAYSANQNNPDTIDGFGGEYRTGEVGEKAPKMTFLPKATRVEV